MKKNLVPFICGLIVSTTILAVYANAATNSAKSQAGTKTQGTYVYTADEGGSITIVNAENNSVMKTVQEDGVIHNVQISPDGKTLGAVLIPSMEGMDMSADKDEDSEMKMNGYALFFDAITGKLIKKVQVGDHPAHIVFTNNGKYALVTNNKDNTMTMIDTATYTIKDTIATGKGPHGFRISSNSKFAYVANMGEDTVSEFDLARGIETKKIKVGQTPVTTGITRDGKTMVATLNAENALAIVDLGTGRIDKVDVGSGPAQVYVGPDDRFAFVANQGTAQAPSNTLSKIDLTAKKVVATIQTGKGAHGVVVSNDNKKVYVTNMFDNTVSVIDNTSNQVVATVKVGKTPNGITYRK